MSASVHRPARSGEVKALDLPLIGATPQGQASVKPFDAAACAWLLPLIGGALDRTMSRKEAAYLMGLDQGQMTRQLAGDGHLSVLRLAALGQAFWINLADELRAHFGHLDRAQLIEQGEALIDRGRQLLAKAAAR